LRFFKSGPGEYGEGDRDRFLGLNAAGMHGAARRHRELPLAEVRALLRSSWHEERAVGLLILVQQFRRGDEAARKRIYTLYLRNTRHINNWDLVDCSAEHIVGGWLAARPGERRRVLDRLARSRSLWERRIAVLATFHYIKQRDFRETLRIAAMLLDDEHDLIHKAVGWMLREVGNRNRAAELKFLRRYAARMPRTALRYAIEKFPERERQAWLCK
jgi:3-methyladenine DNA glycosylase AlkD